MVLQMGMVSVHKRFCSSCRSQLEHQLQLKEASLSDLEHRLSLAKEDLAIERNALQTKVSGILWYLRFANGLINFN